MTKNMMSNKYELGVEVFIEFGLRHDNGSNSIRCPCLKCGNCVFEDVTIVRYHLYANGIDQYYKVWFWNGEDLTTDKMCNEEDNNPNNTMKKMTVFLM